jgi:hypothetical protein
VHYSVDRRIQVDFVTVNVGSTNAYIVGRNVTVVLLRYPGEIFGLPFLPTQIATGSDDPIKGGEQVVHTCVDGTPLTEEDFDAINRSEKHLHVLGQVTYTDDNGIFRNVGFFRCYIVDLARFSKIDNDDFEYGY